MTSSVQLFHDWKSWEEVALVSQVTLAQHGYDVRIKLC